MNLTSFIVAVPICGLLQGPVAANVYVAKFLAEFLQRVASVPLMLDVLETIIPRPLHADHRDLRDVHHHKPLIGNERYIRWVLTIV